MRNSLIAKLIVFLLLYPLSINSALSENINNQLLSKKLESILNQEKYELMKDLFSQKSLRQFNKQHLNFRNQMLCCLDVKVQEFLIMFMKKPMKDY